MLPRPDGRLTSFFFWSFSLLVLLLHQPNRPSRNGLSVHPATPPGHGTRIDISIASGLDYSRASLLTQKRHVWRRVRNDNDVRFPPRWTDSDDEVIFETSKIFRRLQIKFRFGGFVRADNFQGSNLRCLRWLTGTILSQTLLFKPVVTPSSSAKVSFWFLSVNAVTEQF